MSKRVEYNAVRTAYVLLLVMVLAYLVSPLLLSIVFAGTVALTMYPWQLALERRGLKRKRAAALLTVFFTIVVSIPFTFFLIKGTMAITKQLEKFYQDARVQEEGVASIVEIVRGDILSGIYKYGSQLGLEEYVTMQRLEGYLAQANHFLLNFFQESIGQLPTIFIYFLIMVLCTYSFLKRADGVRSVFQKTFGFNDVTTERLINTFISDSRLVYITNIVTGSVQSLCVATAVSLLGLGDFFLVFFITLILSFIPVIGAAPVAFIFGVVGFFRGENTAAIIMVAVGAFTGVVDNFLRPYLATLGHSRIPAMAAFICVIGGALLLGFPGLFIGLLAGSFAYDTIPVFWEVLGRNGERKSVRNFIPKPPPNVEESKRH